MKLNIYVGLRAIAFIITEKGEIIKHGLKKVNLSFDNYYEFIAGQPVSLRVNRRQKRQARRNLWRFKSRRENLKYLLKKNGIFSSLKLHSNDILNLRVKGLTQQLNTHELYHVLLSLQKKRGYKSLRGVSDNENSDYLQTIAMHEENRLQYKSIADYLLTLKTATNVIFNRSSYEEEFWQIMNSQVLPDELKQKIFSIIFFQRPLAKGKIGNCKVEFGRKVMHESSPAFQKFRCWRDVQNIIIWDEQEEEIEISNDIRKQWFERLFSGKNITKSSCCKDLGINKSTSYTWLSGKQLAGNPVAGISESLWQDLFSAVEDDRLKKLLKAKYKFNDFKIDQLVDLDLHKLGWSDYSAKAVRKLTPSLEIMQLSKAILDIYGKVEMKDVALRNVVLEKHFDSYKSLLEALQKRYHITELQFEIDHLLKAGNKQRKQMAKNKRADLKFEKENAAILAGRSSYDILKYKLWKESEEISPFEPDVKIELKDLFSDKYNLDHIVPKSKIFETGVSNMVLCRTDLNEEKGRATAHEFALSKGITEDKWKEVAEKFGRKKQFLLMKESEIPKDWISKRQNSDYNTKCFGSLGGINIPNKLINKFAGEWNMKDFNSDDMRYYLQKCFVLANLSQDTVNRFDNIGEIKQSVYKLEKTIRLPHLFESVIPFVPKVKLTRKSKFGYTPAKQLHQETILGKRTIDGATFYKVRQPITKLSPRMVQNIYSEDMKDAIEKWIAQHEDIEAAKASLAETPFFFRGNPVSAVSVRMTDSDLPFLRHKSGDLIHSKNIVGQPVDFVYSETNYAISVSFDEKGKIKKNLITLLEHCDNLNSNKTSYPGKLFQMYETVRYRGKLYIFIGCGNDNAIRPIFDLSATEVIRVNSEMYQEMEIVQVNQLGETYGNS